MSARACPITLLGRNAAQLFFCFVGSAVLNVLSQAHFARSAPEAKDAWLSGTLLLGTIAAIAGVGAARRVSLDDHPAATLAGIDGLEQLEEPIAEANGVVVAHHTLALDRQDRF